MAVGKCEHKVVCLKCTLKLWLIQKNFKCIYCNIMLDEIAVVDEKDTKFDDVCNNMKEFKLGICFTNGWTKGACFYLKKFKCSIENCKEKDYFSNPSWYKKHLK